METTLTPGLILGIAQVVVPVFRGKRYKQSDRRGNMTTYHSVANGPRKNVVVFTEVPTLLSEMVTTRAKPVRVQVSMITEDDARSAVLGMSGLLSILGIEFYIQEREGTLGPVGESMTPQVFLEKLILDLL